MEAAIERSSRNSPSTTVEGVEWSLETTDGEKVGLKTDP